MRVLHVAAYFAPAFVYGGPPRSILGLCQALRRAGIEASVFTTTANGREDFPASSNGQQAYDGVPVRYFPRRWPKRFFAVEGLAETLIAEAGNFDLLHLHGLWNLTVWAAARAARKIGMPYLISPRGMLDGGAMNHEAARKFIAWHLAERQNLLGARLLHATSESEAKAIAAHHLHKPITIIPNGIEFESATSRPTSCQLVGASSSDKSSARQDFDKLAACRTEKLILFLGRIHPIKRLDLLAAAFVQIKAKFPETRLVIAGPDESGHRRTVEPLLASVADSVDWLGEIGGTVKAELLQNAAVLAQCSDSENFGLSVPEALAAGTPVVTTRTTPWAEVETIGCGFCVEQNAQAIANAVCRLLDQPQQAAAMGERGARWVREKFGWDTVASQMVNCYDTILNRRQ